ncbi:MAG: hypothetical protein R2849_20380 [Thermomicrobiales bacterium]
MRRVLVGLLDRLGKGSTAIDRHSDAFALIQTVGTHQQLSGAVGILDQEERDIAAQVVLPGIERFLERGSREIHLVTKCRLRSDGWTGLIFGMPHGLHLFNTQRSESAEPRVGPCVTIPDHASPLFPERAA